MPLAFESRSHGTVAFGFFNIESDMLLLENLFFFADRFCAAATDLLTKPASSSLVAPIDAWRIDAPAKIGNLHGAIAGSDLSGFIGATYAEFPFPADPVAFRQNPQGFRTQAWVSETVTDFGSPEVIELMRSDDNQSIAIAELSFSIDGFRQLIAYVEQGGYPRWKDEIRPGYVEAMSEQLTEL